MPGARRVHLVHQLLSQDQLLQVILSLLIDDHLLVLLLDSLASLHQRVGALLGAGARLARFVLKAAALHANGIVFQGEQVNLLQLRVLALSNGLFLGFLLFDREHGLRWLREEVVGVVCPGAHLLVDLLVILHENQEALADFLVAGNNVARGNGGDGIDLEHGALRILVFLLLALHRQ